jgi:hypothetical protein
MSTIAIVLIVLGVLVAAFFIGGLLGARRRDELQAPERPRHIAEADRALERARAADRGWDRGVMEEVARRAIGDRKPGWQVERLELVLVDDRPGMAEDRAHFVAGGGDDEVRVLLTRTGDGHWVAHQDG